MKSVRKAIQAIEEVSAAQKDLESEIARLEDFCRENDVFRAVVESVRDCPRPTCFTCRQAAVDALDGRHLAAVLCRVSGRSFLLGRFEVARLVEVCLRVLGIWDPDGPLDHERTDDAISDLADLLETLEIERPAK